MRQAYQDIMAHVSVSDAMRQRVLAHIQQAEYEPRPAAAPRAFRRWLAAAACVVLLIGGAAVIPRVLTHQSEPAPPVLGTAVPNFFEVSSSQELEQMVGFQVETLTYLPFTVEDTRYTVLGAQQAEVRYSGQEETAVYRKAAGRDDPSGDYTQYSDVLELELDGLTYTLKGSDGAYSLALWQVGEYSCSVRLSTAQDQGEWKLILGGMEQTKA